MDNFNSQIALILEVESVDLNDELKSFEFWDSLSILSIIALASETYKVEITADDVNNAKTIGGLWDLIKSRM